MTETLCTVNLLRDIHPDRFCRSTIKRGRFAWVCYHPPNHDGPHQAGNSDNDPIYRSWFDVIDGNKPSNAD